MHCPFVGMFVLRLGSFFVTYKCAIPSNLVDLDLRHLVVREFSRVTAHVYHVTAPRPTRRRVWRAARDATRREESSLQRRGSQRQSLRSVNRSRDSTDSVGPAPSESLKFFVNSRKKCLCNSKFCFVSDNQGLFSPPLLKMLPNLALRIAILLRLESLELRPH